MSVNGLALDSESVGNQSEMKYRAYTLGNYRRIQQISCLTAEQIEAIEVVGRVLPFKTNNYVVDELIDWKNIPNDPMFILNFPQKEMLLPPHYEMMKRAVENGQKSEIDRVAHAIRLQLNPHPAGQVEHNVPKLRNGKRINGLQHKYRDTCLVFPNRGQTCHAYCSFCFRWPQFVGMDELKFAVKEAEEFVRYLSEHPEITDVLFTGGDPMIMKSRVFAPYISAILDGKLDHIRNIRIGSKALGYWPYRFTTDNDATEMLAIFDQIVSSGRHLSFMAHFNHPIELSSNAVKEAIRNIRRTGAQIRTQSPLLRNINDEPRLWSKMWKEQVALGCIPYYMFVARDTGAQHYFSLPLVSAQRIFSDAYRAVSGLCRTVRGPSMSCTPGKLHLVGVANIGEQKAMVLRFIRARDSEWVHKPFLAKYSEQAIWIDDLEPLEGKTFFFEKELSKILASEKRGAIETPLLEPEPVATEYS